MKKLNDAGTWTICYITIGEDDSLNTADGLGEGGYASYYIYENGSPKMNTNWNSYFVDAGSPVWQEIIIERARNILAMGADGLFLDTVDSVDVDAA
ncbi:MAG: endo alpha-1,4 polygalactosaminidase, partial [Clostridia bacterium]|nr:endo alpha-1,4 polygalactosaminidase [Clostridia bacterium]